MYNWSHGGFEKPWVAARYSQSNQSYRGGTHAIPFSQSSQSYRLAVEVGSELGRGLELGIRKVRLRDRVRCFVSEIGLGSGLGIGSSSGRGLDLHCKDLD